MLSIRILFILISTFILTYCSTSKKLEKGKHYNFEISFGRTGGFSNINPVYSIKSTGDVYKKDNNNSVEVLLKTIDKHKIDSLYLLIKTCEFESLKVHEISNITNYIELKSNTINNKILWYDDSQISPELKKLDRFLIAIIKK